MDLSVGVRAGGEPGPRSWCWRNLRLLLYIGGFAGAAILDAKTPLGVGDWLIELILVWVAATWGGPREMIAAAAAGTATMLAGLVTSPLTYTPFWIGGLNRLVAIGVIWAMVHVSRARRLSEAARAKAAAEIKVLEGLLPICARCKCIRSHAGEWHNLESYITNHSQAKFSHTYCPECAEKYFPEIRSMAGD